MSPAPLCRRCGQRPARYITKEGRLRSDEEHDLCLRCFHDMRESQQAGQARSFNARPALRHRSKRLA